jgi:hypothetical protein
MGLWGALTMLKTLFTSISLCACLMASAAIAAPGSADKTSGAPAGDDGSSEVVATAASTTFQSGYSSTWFAQIGLTGAIETQAKEGAGTTIGLVDTGVIPTNPEIAGRVSSQSSCAAVTFKCSNGYVDDNGHGTATASIAAGAYNANDLMSGVAPAATIVEEKVLNAQGSGYDTDVANGITKAANAGAQVINLSLTYTPTAAVISAINYATSKGAVIVYAGGNSSAPLNGGVNTTGLTTTSLTHMIFVGSVNSSNVLSTFSNTPGGGSAYAGTAHVSYAALWLVAPGENIVAPGIQFGSNAYAYWTGTSMAAPMVSGSIALLEDTWPVLTRNGTAAAVLFDTATDLGAKGVDTTYGNGLLNLTAAFQPIGALSVIGVKGQSIPVSQLTGGMLASGALGSLSAIKSQLASYTTFDTFQRNFTSNLSGLITSQSSLPGVLAQFAAPPLVVTGRNLAGGGYLTLAASDLSYFEGPGAGAQSVMLSERTSGPTEAPFFMSLTSAGGATLAAGRGLPSTASFANAMWGSNGMAAYQTNELGVSNALMGFAQGGYFASAGVSLGPRTRLAAAWTNSPPPPMWNIVPDQELPQSSAAAVGLSRVLTDRLSAGVTVTALSERDGLLGTTYSSQSPLSFGDQHQSVSIGLTSALNLGGGRGLVFDATMTRTSAATPASGLVGAVTPVVARAYGVSFVQTDAFQPGDHLTVSVSKPLRVVGGSAELAVTTVDSQGFPTTSLVKVGLKPGGDETDGALAYAVRLSGGFDLTTGLDYRADAYNVAGLNDVLARLSLNKRF